MYNYLFGPVPSRRLKMSLGVDLVPHKVCNMNCVYCECGVTTRLTTERREYVEIDGVKRELLDFFEHNPVPDYVTLSGSGEPTLNSGVGEVLAFLQAEFPAVPVAVLTNGSLLSDPQLRSELLPADVVLPSLDAATDAVLRRINRPAHGLTAAGYIAGLVSFRREYTGKIWLEVLILPGYNDQAEELERIGIALQRIQPDSIHIQTLDRPGVVPELRPAAREDLEKIADSWREYAPRIEVVAPAVTRKETDAYRTDADSAILETIARRPCTIQDIGMILGMHANEIQKYLSVMEKEQRIVSRREHRGVFYSLRR